MKWVKTKRTFMVKGESRPFWKAVRSGLMLDFEQVSASLSWFSGETWSQSYEKALLEALILLARNESGDLEGAISILESLLAAFEKSELENARRCACNVRYVFRLYALILYADATCHYYKENDQISLELFTKCQTVFQDNRIKSICGVARLRDIRRKVDSLSFRFDSDEGFPCVVRLMNSGQFDAAARLLDRMIKKIGVDFLDHDVLILAAKVHFLLGDLRQGAELASVANCDSPMCSETQFLYALSLVAKPNQKSLKRFLSVFAEFSQRQGANCCRLSPVRMKRMQKLLGILKKCVRDSTSNGSLSVETACAPGYFFNNKLNVARCLCFVDPELQSNEDVGNFATLKLHLGNL